MEVYLYLFLLGTWFLHLVVKYHSSPLSQVRSKIESAPSCQNLVAKQVVVQYSLWKYVEAGICQITVLLFSSLHMKMPPASNLTLFLTLDFVRKTRPLRRVTEGCWSHWQVYWWDRQIILKSLSCFLLAFSVFVILSSFIVRHFTAR